MNVSEDALQPPAAGVHPWCGSSQAFAGWIPNVSGHLSFNQVDPRGRQSTYNNQVDLAHPRTVVAHRTRLAQDYPWWDWIVSLFRPQARQDFLLLTESGAAQTPFINEGKVEEVSDEHGALYGVIVVSPSDDEPDTEQKRRQLLAEIDAHIAGALVRRAEGSAISGERLALDVLRKVNVARRDVALYAMRFAIFRTGECRIWFEMNEFLGRDVVATPPTHDEAFTADKLPAQAYYFVKDLLHAHYHHDPSSDQILPLTRLEPATSPVDVLRNEVKWRYVSLRGLVRVVVELRQGRSVRGHKRALGIIAYATAFQAVLAKAIRTVGGTTTFTEDGKIIPYDFSSLEKSIEATDHSVESVMTSRLQLFGIEVGILLSALALWAGAVQIQPILCASKEIACPKIGPGPIVSFVNVVVANPLGFTVSLLALGFLLFVMFFRGTGAIPYAERFVRFLKGLSDAIASQISKVMKGMDILGWLFSLVFLGGVVWSGAKLAYWLVPKTHVPPVSVTRPRPPAGPWSSLQGYVGKPVGAGGLLTTSVVAQDIRNLLGSDYYAHANSLEAATLKRDGNVFYASSVSRPGADGGFIILDAASRRMVIALREDGRLHPHSSPGGDIPVPRALRSALGSTAGLDADPVPVAAPSCAMVQGGNSGGALQLSGALRADGFCTFGIPLQKGQALSFNPAKANGLYVAVVENKTPERFAGDYIAIRSGRHVVRVGWSGWRPTRQQIGKTRPFFVRLNVQ